MEQVQKVDAPINPSLLKVRITPPPTGVAREVSTLDEGEAMLQWPATLSAESVEELEDWLNLVLKKLKRRFAEPKESRR